MVLGQGAPNRARDPSRFITESAASKERQEQRVISRPTRVADRRTDRGFVGRFKDERREASPQLPRIPAVRDWQRGTIGL